MSDALSVYGLIFQTGYSADLKKKELMKSFLAELFGNRESLLSLKFI